MKHGHLVVAGLFLLFAFFQLNDPDPWGWITLYLLVAAVALLAFWGRIYRWIIVVGLLLAVVWGTTLLPAIHAWVDMGMPSLVGQMRAEVPHIEEVREFWGLIFCVLVLSAYLTISWLKLPGSNMHDSQ